MESLKIETIKNKKIKKMLPFFKPTILIHKLNFQEHHIFGSLHALIWSTQTTLSKQKH